jgi:hypothetical protein
MRPCKLSRVLEERTVDSGVQYRIRRIRPVRATLLALVLAIVAALSVAGVAVAQVDEETTRELFHETSGSFNIKLDIEPVEVMAGVVHFIVTVLEAGDSTPVEGAVVNIVATGRDGSAVQSRAVSAPGRAGLYDANLVLEPGGVWAVVVDVSKEGLGDASHEVSLDVKVLDLSAGLVGTLLWLFTTLALVGGGLYLWRRSRAALSRR